MLGARASFSKVQLGKVQKALVLKNSLFTWHESTKEDLKKYDPQDVFRAGLKHHHICNTAFPIAHNETIRPYRVPRLRDQEAIRGVLSGAYGSLDEMMLYAHVPFCNTRCQFCEYTVVDPKVGRQDVTHDSYISALMDEFRLYDELLDTKRKKIVGFDIGGGTPSMVSIPNIERIMNAAHKHFNFDPATVEVSLETTPRIAASDPQKIKAYHKMGIRRISMGVQTTDFKQAKTIGRDDANASTDYLFRSVDNIRNAGFDSFNIDLMYGFPVPKTGSAFAQTVKDAIALKPEHITLYRMRYKGTKMSHLQDRITLQQVNEEEGQARALLAEAGYKGMVGKNTYSRMKDSSGCSSYLDLRVRKAVPYLGYGLGAQSFSHHTLQYNLGAVTKGLHQYMRSLELNRIPVQDLYHLSREAAIAKMVSVSFYYGGIDLAAFKDIFKISLQDAFADEIKFLQDKKLMQFEGDRFQMTLEGKKHFGGVVAQFYSPSVKNHILNRPGGEVFAEDPVAVLDRKNREYELSSPRAYTPSSSMYTPKEKRFEFGNVLFGGPCNQKCYFCIGHQLEGSLTPNNLRLFPPTNFDKFIERMVASNTKKVIFTGTTTDPLLYKYGKELVQLIREKMPDVHISIHTNGVLATRKIDTFNMFDSCTISLNSFEPETFQKIHGTREMPDLETLVKIAKMPIKLSCILTPHNKHETLSYIYRARDLGIKRIALRHIFLDQERWDIFPPSLTPHPTPFRTHCGNPVYNIDGVEVTHWVFEKVEGNSLNLFSDGTLSEEYLLVNNPKTGASAVNPVPEQERPISLRTN